VTLVIPSNASEYLGVPPFARIAFHSFFVWRGDFFEKVLAMGATGGFLFEERNRRNSKFNIVPLPLSRFGIPSLGGPSSAFASDFFR